MDAEDLYRYAYLKRPLHEVYRDPSEVPPEFLLEWFKDAFDRERVHSEEELLDGLSATPAAILEWLEEAAALTWESKKAFLEALREYSDEDLERFWEEDRLDAATAARVRRLLGRLPSS